MKYIFKPFLPIKLRSITLLILLCLHIVTFGQTEKKGWAANNRKKGGGVFIGIGTIYYNYGLTPLNIYINDREYDFTMVKNFGQTDFSPLFIIGAFKEQKMFTYRWEFSRGTVRTSAEYTDNLFHTYKDQIKISNTQGGLALLTKIKKSRGFSIGASLDLGYFKTRQKITGEGASGQWGPFYNSTALFSTKVKSGTVSAGTSLILLYRFNYFTFSLSRQIMIMDPDLNGPTGRSSSFNTHNFKFTLYYAL